MYSGIAYRLAVASSLPSLACRLTVASSLPSLASELTVASGLLGNSYETAAGPPDYEDPRPATS